MSKSGFLKFPRSFTDDEVWQSLSADYRSIFMTLLVNYAWKDTIQDDHGKLTMVKIGQCLMTERQIMNESFPKSEIENSPAKCKSTVHRALAHFKKVQFSNHETNHKKLLHTLVREDLLDRFEPDFEPNSNQTRTIKEEYQNRRTDVDQIDLGNPDDDSEVLQFDLKKGGFIKSTVNQVTEILKKDDWTEKEINHAIERMKKYNPSLNGKIEAYLTTILKTQKKDSKSCKTLPPKKKKEESLKDSGYFMGSDLSEAPLAQYARQNGYKN